MEEVLFIGSREMPALSIKIALLVLLVLFTVLYAVNPSWLVTNRVLIGLPIQRFKWKSETHLSSNFNRFASLITTAFAIAILIRSYFFTPSETMVFSSELVFIGLICAVIIVFLLKFLSMKLFFYLNEDHEVGTMVIDYQYAFNQFIGLVVFLAVCLDLFYFRLNSPIQYILIYVLGFLYLLRLLGHIVLLLNKMSYPIISLFIYLCAFEIAPMLVVAKVLFENS
ncbi:MAG: DUF4271 domain-containing protein [Bacteroidia bacterium]